MEKRKTVLSALLVMVLWGSLFPMVKLGYGAYGIVTTGDILFFAGVRFTLCGAIISLFAALRDRKSFAPAKSAWMPILLSGLFAIILHYSFTYLGLQMTDSSKTALIKQVGTLLYVCFSFLFFKEDRPTAQKIVAALIGFAGIAVLNIDGGGISFSVGDLLILCASLCTVFSNVIGKRVFATVSPVTATGISQLFGGIVLLLVGVLMGGGMRMQADLSILIMVYICAASIVSYCLWYGIVKNGELSKLFIIKFAEPVFACIFGALILGENILKWQYLVAFLLIAGGICLSNLKRKK